MILARSLIYDVLIYALMTVMGICFAPLALVSRAGTYWVLNTYARAALWLLRVICGLTVEVRGTAPTGATLVIAKHQSFLDILALFAALERPRFIMKRELLWTPFIGIYAWRTGSLFVNRGKRSQAIKAMIETARTAKGEPGQLVIYPQGTRVAAGVKAPYKIGAAALYAALEQPATMVATNVGWFWGRKSLRRWPGRAVVEFMETVPPGMGRDPFMALIEERIESESDRLLEEAQAAHPRPKG